MYNTKTVISVAELLVFCEPLFARARVAFVGSVADGGVGEAFEDLDVRSLHLFDPDAAHATPSVSHFSGAFPVRDGAFDVVVCADLTAIADARAALIEFRRVLGRQGVLVLASPNQGDHGTPTKGRTAFGYYELYDAVALQFHSVRMYGATPFFGRAIVELGNEEPDVSVDGSLALESTSPGDYVVVASQSEARALPGYSLIETSPTASPAPSKRFVDAAGFDTGSQLAEARLKVELLTAQLEQARADQRIVASSKGLEEDLRKKAARLEIDLNKALENIASLRQELELERKRAAQRSQEVAVLTEDLERSKGREADTDVSEVLKAELAEVRSTLSTREAELLSVRAKLSNELEAARLKHEAESKAARQAHVAELEKLASKHAAEVEKIAAAHESELEPLRRQAAGSDRERVLLEEHAKEVQAFEEKIRELGRALEADRRALADRARMIEDLLRTPPPADETALRSKLDHLALDVARRESEVRASAWRIAELEEQVRRRDVVAR